MTHHTPPPDPARSRKVFWIKLLSAMALSLLAVFVLYRVVAYRALNQRIEAIRESGYPIDLAELDAFYETPEGKNAADVYLRAFKAFPADPDTEGVPIVSTVDNYEPGQPLEEDMASRIEAYLAEHAKAISLLEEAALIESCRFPIDLNEGLSVLLPQLGQLRKAARTLKLQSILDAHRGEYDLAASRCVTMIALARSIENEPILISSLVSTSIHQLAYGQIEWLVASGHLSDDSLQALTRALEPIDINRMALSAMVGERSIGHGVFTNSDLLADEFAFGSGLGHLGLAGYRTLGLLDIDHNYYLAAMQTHIDFVEHPTWPLPASLDDGDQIPRLCVVSNILIPALQSSYKASLRSEAKRRVVLAGIAAERYRQKYGTLPAQLNDLAPEFLDAVPQDPFDSQPLRYRTEETGVIIYSLGDDGTDDSGALLGDVGADYQDGTDIPFTFGGLQDLLWPQPEEEEPNWDDPYGYGGYGEDGDFDPYFDPYGEEGEDGDIYLYGEPYKTEAEEPQDQEAPEPTPDTQDAEAAEESPAPNETPLTQPDG